MQQQSRYNLLVTYARQNMKAMSTKYQAKTDSSMVVTRELSPLPKNARDVSRKTQSRNHSNYLKNTSHAKAKPNNPQIRTVRSTKRST